MVVNSLTEVYSNPYEVEWRVSKLKERREAAGLSMSELARRAGTNQPQVWRFEHGAVPNGLKTALALAAVFRCQVTDLWPEAAPQRTRAVVGNGRPNTPPNTSAPLSVTGRQRQAAGGAVKSGTRRKTAGTR